MTFSTSGQLPPAQSHQSHSTTVTGRGCACCSAREDARRPLLSPVGSPAPRSCEVPVLELSKGLLCPLQVTGTSTPGIEASGIGGEDRSQALGPARGHRSGSVVSLGFLCLWRRRAHRVEGAGDGNQNSAEVPGRLATGCMGTHTYQHTHAPGRRSSSPRMPTAPPESRPQTVLMGSREEHSETDHLVKSTPIFPSGAAKMSFNKG